MKRGIFNTLSILLLVLCIGTLALFVRSHYTQDVIEYGNAGGQFYMVTSHHGRLTTFIVTGSPEDRPLNWLTGDGNPRLPFYASSVRVRDYEVIALTDGSGSILPAGWNFATPIHATGLPFHGMSVKHYWLALVFGILPAFWIVSGSYRWRQRRRAAAKGRCSHCGYDLRATPDRCPECGAVPRTKIEFAS